MKLLLKFLLWIAAVVSIMGFRQTPASAQLLSDDQMANQLYVNQQAIEDYRLHAHPDGAGHLVGGPAPVCNYAVVCDTAALVFCVPSPTTIASSGIGDYRQCKYARPGQEPKGNEIAPPDFHVSSELAPNDMERCGFAKGAGRLPCQYVGVFDASSANDILDQLNTNNHHYGKDQALKRDDAWVRGYTYARAHGWKQYQPIPAPPVIPSPTPLPSPSPTPLPSPSPSPTPVPDACLDQFDWQSNGVDCEQWDSCQQRLTSHLLAKTCVKSCTLADCIKSYESVGAGIPSLSGQRAAAYFEQNQVAERAKKASQSIDAFLAAAGDADLSGSYYSSGVDQCFFSAVLSLTTQRQSTRGKPAVSGTCNTSANTPKLSVLKKYLDMIANGQPLDNLAQDSVKPSITAVYRLANLLRLNKLNASTLLAGVPADSQSALQQPTTDLLTSLKKLISAPGEDSFYDILRTPAKSQYLAVARTSGIVKVSPSELNDAISAKEAEYSGAGVTFCVVKPDPRALDSFAKSFVADVRTAAHLNAVQNKCHPPAVLPKAGPKKNEDLPEAGPKKHRAGSTK